MRWKNVNVLTNFFKTIICYGKNYSLGNRKPKCCGTKVWGVIVLQCSKTRMGVSGFVLFWPKKVSKLLQKGVFETQLMINLSKISASTA